MRQQLTSLSSQHIPGPALFLNTSYPRAASHTGQIDKSVFGYHVVWLQPSLLTTSFKHVAVGMHPIVPPLTLI